MIRIAIVDDDSFYAETLEQYLRRFEKEEQLRFSVQRFSNAVIFLEHYEANFDIIFMDIKMPMLNGMDAAHKLREIDQRVALLFVTETTQFAVSGYEVDAVDYIVKPVKYFDFALKLAKALKTIHKKSTQDILIPTESAILKLSPDEIAYIESDGHHILYHTTRGILRQYNTLSAMEKKLQPFGFARCNSCYLVNLALVKEIKGYTVTVGEQTLRISQPRKAKFIKALMDHTEANS